MFQVNKYRKECHIDEYEQQLINEFLTALFKVKYITRFELDVNKDAVIIEGFEEEKGRCVNSNVHRYLDERNKAYIKKFKEYLKEVNKNNGF